MDNENEYVKQATEGFEKAVEAVRKLRGGVKTFVIIAEAAETEPESTGRGTVNAIAGGSADILKLTANGGVEILSKILMQR